MSLARSFLWLTVGEIFFNLSGYIVHSGAGRLLTPADYGRYGLIVTLTVMIIDLVANGIPISMSKYISEYHGSDPAMIKAIKRKAFILQMIVIGAITLLFYIITPVLSNILGDPSLTPLFRISLFILPAYALDTYYFYYYTGIHQFNLQSGLKVVRSVLRVTLILGLIMVWKLKGAIAGYIFVNLAGFLIAWIIDMAWLSKKNPLPKNILLPDFKWKKLLDYAWPITLFIIFYEILISLDIYFIKGILHNDYLTGIYNSALLVARIPYYLFYAMTLILLPSISKSTSSNDFERAREILRQSLRFMIIVLVPVVVLIAVFAGPTISFVFGDEYLPGIPSLQILTFGIGFLSVFYVLSFALNGAGKVKVPMFIAFFGMLLNAILNYFMVSAYGIIGSAIATSITSFLTMLVVIYYSHKYFQKIIDLGVLAKIIIGGIFLLALSMFFPPKNYIFIAWSVILTFIYLVFLYIIKAIRYDDLVLLRSIVRKKEKEMPEDTA